jgi:hypothetical protein
MTALRVVLNDDKARRDVRDVWRRRLDLRFIRLRSGGPAKLLWSLRLTIAAVASYAVATLFFPGTHPLLAPLTALLVVQVTPVSLLASGLDRVVAVVTGVSLAVAFAEVLPLAWWSLGLLIFVSVAAGQALRLRENLIEVAISGMLVLGVGSLDAEAAAAWHRIEQTLVGAAVGIAANLLFPPRVASADAAREIKGLSESISALLNRAADELTEVVAQDRDVRSSATTWLDDARRITHHDVPHVGSALVHAEQGRRLNVRAVGTPDVGPGLRHGLEALERSAIAVSSMFQALADAMSEPPWLPDETAADVMLGLAQTWRELAAGIDTFGQLVRKEAGPATSLGSSDVRALREALDGMQEALARLEDLLMVGSTPQLRELHAVVLSTVRRLLREMDLEQRVRRQIQLLRPTRPRPMYLGRPMHKRRPNPAAITPDDETQPLPRLPLNRRDHPRH